MTFHELKDKWVSHQKKRIISRLSLPKDARILDLGCGERKYFPEGIGVDLDIQNVIGTIVKADARHLPFKDASFDIVFEKDMLHHISEPKNAIQEMKRVGRGCLILVEANKDNFIMKTYFEPRGHRHFDPARMRSLIKNNFEYIFVEAYPFGSRVLPFRIFDWLPEFTVKIIFSLLDILFDWMEGPMSAFIIYKIEY